MIATAILKAAAGSLTASMQRSLLALIGIVIGTASVIAMISVGTIVQEEAARQFRELGTDILNIRLMGGAGRGLRRTGTSVGLDEVLGLADLPTIGAVAPYLTSNGQVFPDGRTPMKINVVGVTADFADLNKLRLAEGRFISDLDRRRYFCVIGAEVAAAMRGAGPIVGGSIRIAGRIYTVIGVLPSTRQGLRRFNVDRAAIIPITTAQRVFPRPEISRITARTEPQAHHLAATAEVKAWFRRKSEHLDVRVQSPEQLIEQMQKQSRMFTLLLGVVGGISLLVGGIGVMNVMLVSVTERRQEIGIRRALGARQRDIQSQFLTESVILSLLGGAFGIAFGIGATYTICRFSGWTFAVSSAAMGLGAGVSRRRRGVLRLLSGLAGGQARSRGRAAREITGALAEQGNPVEVGKCQKCGAIAELAGDGISSLWPDWKNPRASFS